MARRGAGRADDTKAGAAKENVGATVEVSATEEETTGGDEAEVANGASAEPCSVETSGETGEIRPSSSACIWNILERWIRCCVRLRRTRK